MNKILFFISLSLLFSCSEYKSDFEVQYLGNIYSIQNTEFGEAFMDNGILIYYITDTIYKSKQRIFCEISGSQDKGKRWVEIINNSVTDIDSVKIDFTKFCTKFPKKELLKR